MTDSSVPLSRVVAFAVSFIGVALIAIAWIVGAAYDWHVAIMVGITSIPFALQSSAWRTAGDGGMTPRRPPRTIRCGRGSPGTSG